MTRREGAAASRAYPPARKRLGQHFLEPTWVAKLVDVAAPAPHDTFLEIGPGRGALTRALAPRVAALVCVEVDRALAAALRNTLPDNVRVIEADFLTLDLASGVEPAAGERLAGQGHERTPIRVIGNLPYNISTPILFKLLAEADEGRLVTDATLMLQKEVADRLMAAPGSKTYGTLAVQVARIADVERLLTLPPGAFRPPPKVTSTVVRLRFRPSAVDVGDVQTFERLVRGAFAQRRKTIANALAPAARALGTSPAELLARAGVSPGSRPEALSLADFARLSRAVGSVT